MAVMHPAGRIRRVLGGTALRGHRISGAILVCLVRRVPGSTACTNSKGRGDERGAYFRPQPALTAMSFKRPRFPPSRSYQVNVEDDVIPLLRIWIVSARGLPRSAGAVGMPDPYVIVKFNGDKVSELRCFRSACRPSGDRKSKSDFTLWTIYTEVVQPRTAVV